jgi:hypothetical protein
MSVNTQRPTIAVLPWNCHSQAPRRLRRHLRTRTWCHLTVSREGAQLYAKRGDAPKTLLQPESPDLFFRSGIEGRRLFRRDEWQGRCADRPPQQRRPDMEEALNLAAPPLIQLRERKHRKLDKIGLPAPPPSRRKTSEANRKRLLGPWKYPANQQRMKTLHHFDGEGASPSTSPHPSMIESNPAHD